LIKFKWLLKLVHRLLVHPISKPLIPSITYYPQTRQEPGKHSHPELPALGRAEDLSHCSTDCLQIFIYIHFICMYIWDLHPHQPQVGKIAKETCVKSGIPEEPKCVELRRWISLGKLFEETESASAICNVMSLICILQKKNITLNRCKGRWRRRGRILSQRQVSSSYPLVCSAKEKSANTEEIYNAHNTICAMLFKFDKVGSM